MRRTFIALALLGLMAAPISLRAAGAPVLSEEMLPPDALAAVVVRDAAATQTRWKGTALYDVLQTEEMKQMLAPLGESLAKLTQQGTAAIGVSESLAPLFTGEAALAVTLRPTPNPMTFSAGLQVILRPADPEKAKAALDALLNGIVQTGLLARDVANAGGAQCFVVEGEDAFLLSSFSGGMLFLTLGDEGKETVSALHQELLARQKAGGGITDDAEYALMRSKMGAEPEAWAYFGLFPWLERQEALAPMIQPFLAIAGLQELKGCMAGIAIEEQAFRTRAFIHMPPVPNAPKPALITAEQLALVPRDAQMFSINSVNWQGLYDKALMLMGMIPPPVGMEITQGIAKVETAIGMRIRDDILGALQGPMLLYVTEPGSPVGQDYSIFLKVRDRADAAQKLTKLLTAVSGLIQNEIGEGGDGFVRIRAIERPRMTQIYSQSILPGMFTPNFMISDTGWASLGFSARNAVGKMDYFLNHKENIAARPDFAKVIGQVPANYTSINYTDAGRCFGNTLALAQLAADFCAIGGKAAAQEAHGDFPLTANDLWSMDPGRWPDEALLREKLFGAVSVWSPQEDGWLFESYSPVGPLPLPPTEPSLLGGSSMTTVPILAGLLLPALARAREEARMAACRNNISQVGKALFAYTQNNKEMMPASLADLVPNYLDSPNVLVCPSADPADCMTIKNGITTSYRFIGTITPALAPDTIIVYERSAHHNYGRNVGYYDGHVRFVVEPEFQDQLALQYEEFKPMMEQPDFVGDKARVTAFFEDQDFEEK